MKKEYKLALVGLISGGVFGFWLALSDMISSDRLIGFFDVFGDWDPALIATMVGAIWVSIVWNHFLRSLKKPIYSNKWHFSWSNNSKIDTRLVIWSGLFGIGWGISWLCPGPAIANLIAPSLELLALIFCMTVAIVLTQKLFPNT